jgi:hypothetical protein
VLGAFAAERSSNFWQGELSFCPVGTTRFEDKDHTIVTLVQGSWVEIWCES